MEPGVVLYAGIGPMPAPPSHLRSGPRLPGPELRGHRLDEPAVRRLLPQDRWEGPSRLVDRVIIPVKGSADEFVVQRWGIELAAAVGAPALGLHVAPAVGTTPLDVFEPLRREAHRRDVYLEDRTLVGTGTAEQIAAELGPRDLVVIGRRRRPMRATLRGIVHDLVRFAPCPVVVLPLP